MNKKKFSVFFSFTLVSLLSFSLCKTEDFRNYFTQANKFFKQEKYDEAITLYEKTIAASPTNHKAYFNRGLAYASKEDFVRAEKSYRKAIDINPYYIKAYYMLGETLNKQGKIDDAITQYRRINQLDPEHFDAYSKQAKIHSENRRFDKAIKLYKKAMELRPNSVQCKLDYANTLNIMNYTEEALELYKEIDKIIPDSPPIIYNIAYTLKKLGYLDKAFNYYQKVLELDPNHVEGHFGLGLSYLLTGNFERGWEEYEWRPCNKAGKFQKPRWDGLISLRGKTILLYAEQGLGDTFQFIRYAKILKEEHGAKVFLASQSPLIDILSECPYLDKVVSLQDGIVPVFDFHLPLMSAPFLLKTRVETIPTNIPYLYAKQKLVQEWKEKLVDDPNFKIGICWQGNPNYSTPFLRNTVAAKSIDLIEFMPIASIPGVTLYSLQKMAGEEQTKNLPTNFVLHEFGPEFDKTNGRFMDTAAVMKNLDLVLTIDTSIVHLAGGLGVRTWLMLPKPADWRWMMYESKSPWYPGMRLFRQSKPNDWASVIQTVAQELKKELPNNIESTLKTCHLAPHNNIIKSMTVQDLIKTIVQLETHASKTQDAEKIDALRTQIRQFKKQLNKNIKPSFDLDALIDRSLEVNKKLWTTYETLRLLQPDDETFACMVQKIATLCELRNSLTTKTLTVLHKLQGK